MEQLTISNAMLQKILDHYRDAILIKFGNSKILTPATQVQMEAYLKAYQLKLIQRETYPGWSIPLKLIFDVRRSMIDVEPHEGANILVIP